MKNKLIVLSFLVLLSALCAARAADKVRTIITGDEMQLNKGGKVIVFSGKAKVSRGESILRADTLTQDKISNIVNGSGNIDFQSYTKDNELVRATSGRARYDITQEQGTLWDSRPHVVYYAKTSSGPVHVYADAIDFDQRREEITGRGAVEILSSSATVYAPHAVFLQKEKRLTFTGIPQSTLIYKGDAQQGTYTADKITLYLDRKKAFLEGSVRGTIHFEDTGKGAGKP